MSIGTWSLENGFDSPGSTAQSILEDYLHLTDEKYVIPQAAWMAIYLERQRVSARTRNLTAKFNYFDPFVLYTYCNSDLALFIFIILYIETQQFRNFVSIGVDGCNSTLEIIKDVIQKKARYLITLNATIYCLKAYKFINDIYLSEITRDF